MTKRVDIEASLLLCDVRDYLKEHESHDELRERIETFLRGASIDRERIAQRITRPIIAWFTDEVGVDGTEYEAELHARVLAALGD